ncbi:MAG: hypothetical protein NC905_07395 [Candidatus Omnitrophica bacterium]|nr:hypothetical protein [Candidatus Omnitrophota bacterium]
MDIKPLTPEGWICFFGYYNRKQLSPNGRYFLFMKVEFQDREPNENDKAEIFIGEVRHKKYEKLDETYAWNFQQGCMLYWLSDEEIIYNIRIEKEFYSKIYNIKNGKTRIIERPVGCVYPEKNIGLSLNFARLARHRPGYGYAGGVDRYERERWPQEDGVYRIDLITGNYRLVLPLSKVLGLRKEKGIENFYAWFNHLDFNKSGERFCVLNRWKEGEKQPRRTRFTTSDLEGSEAYDLIDSYLISHYAWKNEKEIVVWAEIKGEIGFWIVEDKTGRYKKIDKKIQKDDGHCSFSKDERYLLYDTYPIENHRYLRVFCMDKKEEILIGKFYSVPEITGPIRCDLHPRWEDEKTITIDSTHEGYRRSYILHPEI